MNGMVTISASKYERLISQLARYRFALEEIVAHNGPYATPPSEIARLALEDDTNA